MHDAPTSRRSPSQAHRKCIIKLKPRSSPGFPLRVSLFRAPNRPRDISSVSKSPLGGDDFVFFHSLFVLFFILRFQPRWLLSIFLVSQIECVIITRATNELTKHSLEQLTIAHHLSLTLVHGQTPPWETHSLNPTLPSRITPPRPQVPQPRSRLMGPVSGFMEANDQIMALSTSRWMVVL